MALFKISLHGAGAEHDLHAASIGKEISVRTDHQRSIERPVGEDTQAVLTAIFQRYLSLR